MAKRKPKQPKTIPAMTLQQPYCWLVMEGHVPRERRTHQIDYRGPLVIIAGKRYVDLTRRVQQFQQEHADCPDAEDLPCGVIVGVVDLIDVWETDESGMPWVWELRKPRRPKKPKPYDGAGHILDVEAKLVRGLL